MKKNNKKGFTLVELVIVVAVMAVLVAVAIPTVGSIKGAAEEAVADSNARVIESVIKLAEAKIEVADDGTVSIDAAGIYAAINEAKLGIVSDTYYYNPNNGSVTHDNPGSVTGLVTIVFSAAGVAAGS